MCDDKMLARIAALLRQAEGPTTRTKLRRSWAAAQRLATVSSIDLAPVQRTIGIGSAGKLH
jgi:hypothetical protein